MRHHASRPRAGITLIEVLAAIFIMGIGLLALLVLFPLGALSMARAVRDDRAAAAGANAAAIANALDFRNNVTVVNLMGSTPTYGTAPDLSRGGYPVYLDPYYAQLAGAGNLGVQGTGTNRTPGVPRTNGGYTDTAQIARLFSFMDEIPFDPDGEPSGSSASSVSRPSTYTWAFLIRSRQLVKIIPAPTNATNPKYTAVLPEVAVVVYGGRSLDLVRGENVYAVTNLTLPTNIVTLTWSGEKPKVRKGTWVLDTTASGGTVNAFFYQVAGVRDKTATTIDIELETNLRADVKNLVVMENVITVLERGTGWKP